MEQVYIFNDNKDNAFLSILMNDLSNVGIDFSNLQTTKTIDYNNVLIYIPQVDGNCTANYSYHFKNNMFKFRKILVVCVTEQDYKELKLIHTTLLNSNKFIHYWAIVLDTFISKVLSIDCARFLATKL
jgi:hypothetical protein